MIFKIFKNFRNSDEIKTEDIKKRIIINLEQLEKRIAFMEGARLENFFIQRQSLEPVAGNIYKGIVKNVLPSIQAAFIDIGVNKNGFIHVSDIKENFAFDQLLDEEDRPRKKHKPKVSIQDILKEGQEILVQVRKEAIGQKGVRLTNYISLPGRNLVLIPGTNQRGISRKISDKKERMRLKEVVIDLKIPENFGFIVRTAAGIALQKNLERDIIFLVKAWENILEKYRQEKAPACIHVESDISIKTLRDLFTPDIDEIIVDSHEEWRKIKEYFSHFFPEIKTKILYYKLKSPIFDHYLVEQELSKIFQRKVWLKCGGYIIIDETEALVAIDVNTGRNVRFNNLEETIKMTNLEAAEEIARQLRLRNIGGIIVIDFIDMAKKENRKAVLEKLSEALSKDKAKTNILPISELGLIEMTRQRIKESVNQELYEKCDCCKGRGIKKSILSITVENIRKIKRILLKNREKKIKLILNPDILENILIDKPNFKKELEKLFRKKLYFETDVTIDRESVKAYFFTTGKTEII